jgi:hypothetical protein
MTRWNRGQRGHFDGVVRRSCGEHVCWSCWCRGRRTLRLMEVGQVELGRMMELRRSNLIGIGFVELIGEEVVVG